MTSVGWLCRMMLIGSVVACSSGHVEWSTSPPESRGIDPVKLAAFTEKAGALNSDSLLLARKGDIVLEWYRDGIGREDLHPLASLPKGVVGALMLIAAADAGHLGLDDEAWRYVPSWKDDPVRSRVTLRQLATHCSGLDNVFYLPGADLAGVEEWRRVYHLDATSRFDLAVRRTPFLFPSGERCRYSGNGYYVLAYALARSLAGGPQPDLRRFYAERITERIGIPEGAWSISYGRSYDHDGTRVYAIGSGANFTTRAIARIGQLMLDRGRWQGEAVFDERWMEEILRSPAPAADARELGIDHPESGIGWYLNRDGFLPSLPRDAFFSIGGGHRLVLVVPSLELVFVRTGHTIVTPYSTNAEAPFWPEMEQGFLVPLMAALARLGTSPNGS